MLVCCGEMGRTPRINAGVDAITGEVLRVDDLWWRAADGPSDWSILSRWWRACDDPVTIPDLIATILHNIIDVELTRLIDGLRRTC